MICDGKVLQITTTLEVALREVLKEVRDGWLWMDQICINQKDDNDRSGQVKMMNTIYASDSTPAQCP